MHHNGFLTLNQIFAHGPAPAFNVNNLEFAQGVCEAAAQRNRPLIVAATQGAIRYIGARTLVAMIKEIALDKGVQVCLHLDHGKSLDAVSEALEAGFSSVMFDGSALDIQENIELSRRAANMAHAAGASCEAELGVLAGIEDGVVGEKPVFTDPEQARVFVQETGVDALAVAVGTSHGAYKFKGQARIDIQRVRDIKERVKIPLVLHGASAVPAALIEELQSLGVDLSGAKGVPDEQVKEAVKAGVMKVNIDTDLRLAFLAGMRKHMAEHPEDFDPRRFLGEARDRVKEMALNKLDLVCL